MSIRIFSTIAWSVSIRRKSDILCEMAIFFTSCHTASDMSLRFVNVKDNPCLEGQARIYLN